MCKCRGITLRSLSRALVGVLGSAFVLVISANLCTFVSFFPSQVDQASTGDHI